MTPPAIEIRFGVRLSDFWNRMSCMFQYPSAPPTIAAASAALAAAHPFGNIAFGTAGLHVLSNGKCRHE